MRIRKKYNLKKNVESFVWKIIREKSSKNIIKFLLLRIFPYPSWQLFVTDNKKEPELKNFTVSLFKFKSEAEKKN